MGIVDLLKKLKLKRQSKLYDDDDMDVGPSYYEYDEESGSDDSSDEDGESPRGGVSPEERAVLLLHSY